MFFSDCFEHKQRQCFKCNFEKTCDGMSYAERNFTDCDVIEIETYQSLLSSKKNDLQSKVDVAIKEACQIIEEIQKIQFQMNELIEKDPRVPLEILPDKIKTGQVHVSDNNISMTGRRENLAFFGLILKPKTSLRTKSTGTVESWRIGFTTGWGFSIIVKSDGSRSRVGKVIYDGAAYRAGIKLNDRILEINNVSVTDLNKIQIVEKIRGINTYFLDLLVIGRGRSRIISCLCLLARSTLK